MSKSVLLGKRLLFWFCIAVIINSGVKLDHCWHVSNNSKQSKCLNATHWYCCVCGKEECAVADCPKQPDFGLCIHPSKPTDSKRQNILAPHPQSK